jgi:integrase
MGVKIREKQKGSGVWWLFINYKGKRTSRQIGKKAAAEKAMEHAQARLKLGQDALPKEKPAVPTLQTYWNRFEETYLPSGVRESKKESYTRSFNNHILRELGNVRLDELTREKIKAFVASLVQKRYSRTVKIVTTDENGRKRDHKKVVERP